MNLRPLGYEHNLMMASPFVSKHLVPDGVRFYPLFSNFCEHFVSMNRQQNGFPLARGFLGIGGRILKHTILMVKGEVGRLVNCNL